MQISRILDVLIIMLTLAGSVKSPIANYHHNLYLISVNELVF